MSTGKWTALDSGIGGGVDSYFEYLVKGAVMFNVPEFLHMFRGEIASASIHQRPLCITNYIELMDLFYGFESVRLHKLLFLKQCQVDPHFMSRPCPLYPLEIKSDAMFMFVAAIFET